MAIFRSKETSNDITINDAMGDDEVVASDVPPRYLFLSLSPFFLDRVYRSNQGFSRTLTIIRHCFQGRVGNMIYIQNNDCEMTRPELASALSFYKNSLEIPS